MSEGGGGEGRGASGCAGLEGAASEVGIERGDEGEGSNEVKEGRQGEEGQ